MPENDQCGKSLEDVLMDVIKRRSAGESIDDEAVAARHPTLAPALAERLAELRLVEEAELEALDSTSTSLDDVAKERAVSDTLAMPAPAGVTASTQLYPRIPGYTILDVLGQGGMGIVYRAVQNKLSRTVALKVLPAVVGNASPSAVARFRREASAAARLHHSNIVPVYDFGESAEAYYFAMELVVGRPLNELIQLFGSQNASAATVPRWMQILRDGLSRADLDQQNPPAEDASRVDPSSGDPSSTFTSSGSRGKPYFQQVSRWMADAADALHHAHGHGIYHRDVKPANLIVAFDGRVMVADFGLARLEEEDSITVTGSLMGTLRYMSPEQAMAKRIPIDQRTDVYSLGATMYELLCFQPAFDGADEKEVLSQIITKDPTPPRRMIPLVPIELETICLKAMEKAPASRYGTAREFAEDLRRYMRDLPIVARRPSIAHRMRKFTRRHRAMVVGSLSMVLIAIVGAYAVLASRGRVEESRLRRQAEVAHRVESVNAAHESGMTLTLLGKWEGAERDFRRALKIDPHHIPTLLKLAWMKTGQYRAGAANPDDSLLEVADEACRQVLAIDPDEPSALNMHGGLLKKLDRLDDARRVFMYLMQVDPRRCVGEFKPFCDAAISNLGMVNALLGNLPEALTQLREGAKRVGSHSGAFGAAAWRNLGSLQHYLDDPEALDSLEKAVICKRDDVASLVLCARARLHIAGSEEARIAMADASFADRLADGRNPRAKRVRALAALRAEQPKDAIEHALAAIELGDEAVVNHLIIAQARARLGRHEEARNSLAAAKATWPKDLRSPGAFRVAAPGGELWFESERWLRRLEREIEQLNSATRSSESVGG